MLTKHSWEAAPLPALQWVVSTSDKMQIELRQVQCLCNVSSFGYGWFASAMWIVTFTHILKIYTHYKYNYGHDKLLK